MAADSPHSIIVRLPNWLGDFVMATPILADLREHYPEAIITAMCPLSLGPLLKHDPHIDEIFNFIKPNGLFRRVQQQRIIEELRKGQYDLGLLLPNSFSSAWWFWRGRVSYRIGYNRHFRRFLLSKALPFPKEMRHLVVTYKMLLQKGLGIPLSKTLPHLFLSQNERAEALQSLNREGVDDKTILIGMNPGAAYGSAKCWPYERFRTLTEKFLRDERIRIVFFGDAANAPLIKMICAGMPKQVINYAGLTSLRELMALIEACDLLLTNDSGPMHIASALGTPLLALFGSTSDVMTGPYNQGKVIHKHVACSPCFRRECPIDFRCMKRIEVEEVYQEMLQIISELPPMRKRLAQKSALFEN